MNNILIACLVGFLGVFFVTLGLIVCLLTDRLIETNKQLLILVVAQSGKPESMGAVSRALVAMEKPPAKNLKGIAPEKKKSKKPDNVNYEMNIGVK